jgi:iodothyronine deiodinase-like protein
MGDENWPRRGAGHHQILGGRDVQLRLVIVSADIELLAAGWPKAAQEITMDHQEQVMALGRVSAALRWIRDRARRRLRHLHSPGVHKMDARISSYQDLYRSLGNRAVQSLRPGECVPELMLHDIQGIYQPLSRCWEKRPALLVTMSLSCGQSRRHARALRRLWRRFQEDINTVIIYVIEPHPINAPSPYADRVWVTTKNEIAGIRCAQPRTLEERIKLARQLRRRFRLSNPMLIDALDDRAWRTFGSAPNIAILVHPGGRIAVKQGWFEPQEMARAVNTLLKNLASHC